MKKTTLLFPMLQEMELSSSKLNMFKVASYGVLSIFTTVKHREISCEPYVEQINF